MNERAVRLAADGVVLDGDLIIPDGATGLVIFAHGSGSSRHSPRNRYVASALNGGGLATLLIDLLTPEEEEIDIVTAELRFDIGLLARRLVGMVDQVVAGEATRELQLGLFGSSTGAAGALIAAAARPDVVGAVVSRGGRPDLAQEALARVRAPTLLIVGGRDVHVLDLNRKALAALRAESALAIVPRATHLFEERGALEEVARLARDWFASYLGATRRSAVSPWPNATGP